MMGGKMSKIEFIKQGRVSFINLDNLLHRESISLSIPPTKVDKSRFQIVDEEKNKAKQLIDEPTTKQNLRTSCLHLKKIHLL